MILINLIGFDVGSTFKAVCIAKYLAVDEVVSSG
jgi:hypothetical protein